MNGKEIFRIITEGEEFKVKGEVKELTGALKSSTYGGITKIRQIA